MTQGDNNPSNMYDRRNPNNGGGGRDAPNLGTGQRASALRHSAGSRGGGSRSTATSHFGSQNEFGNDQKPLSTEYATGPVDMDEADEEMMMNEDDDDDIPQFDDEDHVYPEDGQMIGDQNLPVEQDERARNKRLALVVGLIVVVVGGAIGAVFYFTRSTSSPRINIAPPIVPDTRAPVSPSDTPRPTLVPVTAKPSRAPVSPSPSREGRQQRFATFVNALIQDGVSDANKFIPPTPGTDTPRSSQLQAVDWMLDEDPRLLLDEGKETPGYLIVQRYIATTFYFQMTGKRWNDNEFWLTGAHECDWFGFSCVDLPVPNVPLFEENASTLASSRQDEVPTVEGRVVIQIDLESNNLLGILPDEIGFFSTVTHLGLWDNSIVGTIPRTIGIMNKLVKLYLDDNPGLTGPLPAEIGQLRDLDDMTLYNTGITGSFPSEIGKLTSLSRFWANGVSFTGTIPTEIGNLKALKSLYLDECDFEGTIPSQIGECTNLEDMRFFNNELTGTIPSEMYFLSNLKILYLDNNDLNGTISPLISGWGAMQDLQIFNNLLEGQIPESIGNLPSLRVLVLKKNKLTGTIPSAFGKAGNLVSISLGENQMDGRIPDSIKQNKGLVRLKLESNKFVGPIPSWMASFENLKSLNLQDNRFSGPVPTALENLVAAPLEEMHLEKNDLTGAMPIELCEVNGLVLTADCGGAPPEVSCECCSQCFQSPGK